MDRFSSGVTMGCLEDKLPVRCSKGKSCVGPDVSSYQIK